MKNKMLIQLLAVTILSFGAMSCKKDKDEPNNFISDTTGIQTNLTWTLNSGAAADNTDLDIELYKGTGVNKISTGYSSSSTSDIETIEFPASMEDGDYTLELTYYDVSEAGKMKFEFKGINTPTNTYTIGDIAFSTSNNDTDVDMIKITKSGSKFTFTKL